MTHYGQIKGNAVILHSAASLPADGTTVRVELTATDSSADDANTEREAINDPITELAAGMDIQSLSDNADYYLYGHPKG